MKKARMKFWKAVGKLGLFLLRRLNRRGVLRHKWSNRATHPLAMGLNKMNGVASMRYARAKRS